jgi:anti-sigma28 factor (negative regulator of flagellin synthesis)
MKVTESNPLASLAVSGGSPSARPSRTQTTAESSPQTELSLTAATQSVFAGRPERIAELRGQVESGSYSPDTQLVGEKMVSEALSRPA